MQELLRNGAEEPAALASQANDQPKAAPHDGGPSEPMYRKGPTSRTFLQRFRDNWSFFSRNRILAIDLGTAVTSAAFAGSEPVDMPSMVATDTRSDRILAIGEKAKTYFESENECVQVKEPLSRGVVKPNGIKELVILIQNVAFHALGNEMPLNKDRMIIKSMIEREMEGVLVVVGVPPKIRHNEMAKYVIAGCITGALGQRLKDVRIVSQPNAGAIGSGLPMNDPLGNMIVDMGGGTTDVALLSIGNEVRAFSIDVGGIALDEALRKHVQERYKVDIGRYHSELGKFRSGSAVLNGDNLEPFETSGTSTGKERWQKISLQPEDFCQAYQPLLEKVAREINQVVTSKVSPRLPGHILKNGIRLIGGSANLRNLGDFLSDRTGIRYSLSPDPQNCVLDGLLRIGQDQDRYQQLFL